MQALLYTALWRPVDPEVEDHLLQETTVVRTFQEHGGKVRPPCGYGLLQAKEEARKVRALKSLMRVSKKFQSASSRDKPLFNPPLSLFCAALFLPAVVSVAVADGELSGRRGAEAGQAAALRCQTHSPLSAPGSP